MIELVHSCVKSFFFSISSPFTNCLWPLKEISWLNPVLLRWIWGLDSNYTNFKLGYPSNNSTFRKLLLRHDNHFSKVSSFRQKLITLILNVNTMSARTILHFSNIYTIISSHLFFANIPEWKNIILCFFCTLTCRISLKNNSATETSTNKRSLIN